MKEITLESRRIGLDDIKQEDGCQRRIEFDLHHCKRQKFNWLFDIGLILFEDATSLEKKLHLSRLCLSFGELCRKEVGVCGSRGNPRLKH